MSTWLILTATLPTSPSGLRVRIWRALKATHCATLREGVYLLPSSAATAPHLAQLGAAIREAGATAHLLELQARDEAQEATFRTLFDRSLQYADFHLALKGARPTALSAPEAVRRKTLNALAQQLQTLQAGDFFPGPAAEAARQGLQALQQQAERLNSPGEPKAMGGPIPRLNAADFQHQVWATRARPWIDRLGSAWLVQRFIDQAPTFLWLADPSHCPPHARGLDFDGATFTHVGEKVTFEVLACAFGLDADPALQSLAALVHSMDVGGSTADEAPGLALLVRGLQAQHTNDDALLQAACPLFDSLYAAFGQPTPR